MKKILVISILAIILILGLNACVKDNFKFNKWDKEIGLQPSLAIPVVWGDLSIAEAVLAYDSTGQMIINEFGFISLLYKTNVNSTDVGDIIYVPNQELNGAVPSTDLDFTGFDNPNDILNHTQNYILPFSLFNNDCEIDSLILKSGILDFSLQSSFQHSIFGTVIFPSIIKEGSPLSIDFNFPPIGGTYTPDETDLSGYSIDLTQTATNFNEIPVQIVFEMYRSASNDLSGQLMFDMDLTDMEYRRIHGYFGYNTLIFDLDTLDIDLFKNEEFSIEEYYFRNPMFRVYYNNSYGIPTNFYFNSMRAYSRLDDLEYSLIDESGTLPLDSMHPYNVAYPMSFDETAIDSIILNRDNSNIDDVISRQPKWLSFIAHAHTNPTSVSHNNFASDTSEILARVEVELPLWGYLENFHSSDTSDFDFSEIYEDTRMITRLQIRLDIKNGIPIEIYGQLYFLDEDYQVLDSLLNGQEPILEAAEIDSDGRMIDFNRKITLVEMDTDDVEQIKDTKYILYKGYANSTGFEQSELVKIYDDYRILFDLAVEADFDISVDLDTIN